jgi:hypothetical protein
MEVEGIASRCGRLVRRVDTLFFSGVGCTFLLLYYLREESKYFRVVAIFVVFDVRIKVSTIYVGAVHEPSADEVSHC